MPQAGDALLKSAVVVVRDPADPETLENDGMAVRRRIVEDSGVYTGRQFDEQDVSVEAVVKPLLPRDVSLDIVLHPPVSHKSHGRIVHAGKSVETPRACLAGTRAADDLAVKEHAYPAGVRVTCVAEGAEEIVARVAVALENGDLRAREHNRLTCVL